MKALFYTFGVLCIYSYFLYPMILKLMPMRKHFGAKGIKSTVTGLDLPELSLIITVKNEEQRVNK